MFGDMDMIPSTMLQSGITESNITVLIGAKNKDLPRFALLGYADQIAFPQTDSMPRAGTLQPEDYYTPPFFAFPKKRNHPASTHRRHCNPIFSLCGLAGSFAPCFQSLPIGLALSSLLYNSRVSDVVTARLHPAQVDVPTTVHSSQHMWSQV